MSTEHTLTSDSIIIMMIIIMVIIILMSSSSLNYSSSGFSWPRIKGLYQDVQRRSSVMFMWILFSLHDSAKHQLLPAQVKRPAPEKPSTSTWEQPVTEHSTAEQGRAALMRLQWHLVVITRYCMALYSLRSHNLFIILSSPEPGAVLFQSHQVC